MAQRPQIWPELAKNTPSLNDPQNSTFHSARGSDSCYIGYQQLYFYWITLSKVIRAQDEEGVLHHKVAPQPQIWPGVAKTRPATITPKIARQALSRDPTAVTLVSNYFFFTKWPKVKLLELKRRFLSTSQSGSATTNMAWIGQKHAQPKWPPKQHVPLYQGIR